MKNLENEYKKSQQETVPDLWNRIEAGLPPKKKKLPIAKITPILGVCAAAVLCIILVPGLMKQPKAEADLLMSAAPKAESSMNHSMSFATNEEMNDGMAAAEPEMESALEDNSMIDDEVLVNQEEMKNSEIEVLQEKMTLVEVSVTNDNYTWKLQRENGDIILAKVSEAITLSPVLSTKYLITLKVSSDEEYQVVQVEELQ